MSLSMLKFLHGEKAKMACNFFHQCVQASVPSPGQENNSHTKLTYSHNNGLVNFFAISFTFFDNTECCFRDSLPRYISNLDIFT